MRGGIRFCDGIENKTRLFYPWLVHFYSDMAFFINFLLYPLCFARFQRRERRFLLRPILSRFPVNLRENNELKVGTKLSSVFCLKWDLICLSFVFIINFGDLFLLVLCSLLPSCSFFVSWDWGNWVADWPQAQAPYFCGPHNTGQSGLWEVKAGPIGEIQRRDFC